jgi:proteasome activator subunit 4
MDSARERFAELLSSLEGKDGADLSRATSPGGEEPREMSGNKEMARHRPRTYPYHRYLPYDVEDDSQRQKNFDEILKQLYIAVEARDFSPGALYWTREIRNWLNLKFEATKDQRVKLVKLYYELSLAPGIEYFAAERFCSMLMVLTKYISSLVIHRAHLMSYRRKHYLKPITDLTLDWRPLYRELKVFVLPSESGLASSSYMKRNYRTINKLSSFAQLYFDPAEIPSMLEEIVPYFTTSFTEGAYVVTGLLNLLLPTAPAQPGADKLLPQYYLPALFHLWSLVNRSRVFDTSFLDLFSRMARDSLVAKHIPFNEFGIFNEDQSSMIFTAVLRLLEIPVGQGTSPYSSTVDATAGLAIMLERDAKKNPLAYHIARWIIMSLSPACLDKPGSIMTNLEGLIQAVETFFHPSNSGGWTKNLSQLVYYLADFFVMRWNREKSGELEMPPERKLNDELKRRFVLCLRDVIFMGIFAKSGTAMNFSLSTLQSLAYLEPSLILPGALQRIYPSMQGLVEVHRTASSLRALQMLSRIMVQAKGFRCHVTTMLGLALPGIDANDLEKTLYTLSYVQSVCYNIPFLDMTQGKDNVTGSMLALEWITSEVDRFEREGSNVKLDYENELTDEDEELILRSSTASFAEFLSSFLGRIFTLLENLPDAARVRSGSPEENVVNTLPATFTPLLATLSPELYDLALNKIAEFIANHVIHQARDAMAFICGALCKVNPGKALKRLVPVLIQSIRTEINENGAASTRNTGTDVLPRDRGLIWNVSMLSMCVVHVGNAVLAHKEELFDIAVYMQQKCKGIPTVHVSNYIHHLLLSLTCTYTVDYSIYEDEVLARGLGPADWGVLPDPRNLNIKWHVPQREEIGFAVRLFKSQGEMALDQLRSLTNGSSSIKRDGIGKEWSDEVSRNLVLIRLLLSGISVLFDSRAASELENVAHSDPGDEYNRMDHKDSDPMQEDEDTAMALNDSQEDEVKPTFKYPAGYLLKEGDPFYNEIHNLRKRAGLVLHEVHQFLVEKQEDDVACFGPLYTAYRSWFVDVGIERSAHTLDRVTNLLSADIRPYRMSGLRKEYPRPLLLRRAHLHHLQRLRHNSTPRPKCDLDSQLLLDLAESSVSHYTEVRRIAQGSAEAAVKVIVGARSLVIPPLLKAFETGVNTSDFPRIKGAMYSLLFGSLAKTVSRDWRHAPRVIKAYIAACTTDKPSIQRLCATATLQLMEFGRQPKPLAIIDGSIVRTIAPVDDVQAIIDQKRDSIVTKRARIEEKKAALSEELVVTARKLHWKAATRTAGMVVNLGLRFESIASDNMIDLICKGAIDSHPGLRAFYCGALVALLSMVDARATAQHKFENFLLDKAHVPTKVELPIKREDPNWTQEFLSKFAKPDAEHYIDHDYPGWLVWNRTIPAYRSNPRVGLEYDEVEQRAVTQIGKILSRSWFSTFFGYLKQEPRDAGADRFRLSNAMLLVYVFELMYEGFTAVNLNDIQEEVAIVFGDGSDKHEHRATAEILGALLASTVDKEVELRTSVWEYAFPIVRKVFADGLTPENSSYWTTFLHLVLQGKDPRRSWPIVDWLASFRLDMSSNAAFKESSKILLVQQCVSDLGWHFQLEKPIIADFLSHLDHPYKGVREAMGHTLATIYRTRYHESYRDIETMIEAQKKASHIGTRPYQPSDDFSRTVHVVFGRLEQWRKERTPGQQTPSSYTSGSKTVLLWLDSTLSSYECVQLFKFFPDTILEQLLHMMDIKEDQELQGLAYHVFRHIPNIPHPAGEDIDLIAALIRIGRNSPLWHQRLRVLINIQVLYFRRLFLLTSAQQHVLFECVVSMLEDSQLEVRLGAASTLSGMVRCSPVAMRTRLVEATRSRLTKMLLDSPLPRKPRNAVSAVSTGTSTPTPEHAKLIISRHAAVLGLGALVQAFPYSSPPPTWIPTVLAFLANKANADPGMVGKSVKSILSDFKKTRQDTWHMDLKVKKESPFHH